MKVLVIGSSNIDITCDVKELPKKGETLMGEAISYSFGGKGANQAVACGKLGADVSFLTCLGNDDHGNNIINQLEKHNVEVNNIKITQEAPTGTAVISVDQHGQNTIVVIAGANSHVTKEYLMDCDNLFKSCDYLLIQMEIPLESIEYAIRRGHELGKTIILNPAPANPNLSKSVYPFIDYFTPNETELCIMANEEDHDTATKKLMALGVKNIIETVGEKGAIWYFENNKKEFSTPLVKAIDTVGAGDCFNGAFVSALSKEKSVEEAIEFAIRAASLSVTKRGAQDSIPNLKEVQ